LILVIRIKIPDWLERIGVCLVLGYRRLRFGYPFRKIPLTQGQYAIVDPDDYPRLATVAQNAWNSKKRNPRSGYKGVCFTRDKGLWRAAIVCNRKRIHLGYFRDKRDAARAYDAAARIHFGGYAVLNLPTLD